MILLVYFLRTIPTKIISNNFFENPIIQAGQSVNRFSDFVTANVNIKFSGENYEDLESVFNRVMRLVSVVRFVMSAEREYGKYGDD